MNAAWRDRDTPRLLLIGLDGVPFKRLSAWAGDGTLPNVAELLRESTCGPLESTIPPATAPAWQVCYTGKNPGKIGVYGFAEMRPFELPPGPIVPLDSRPIAGQTFFDLLGRAGKRVIARQVRCCYPAWDINGLMQTGFPTPSQTDPRRFWPPTAGTLRRMLDHPREKRRDTGMPWGWFSLEQSMDAYLRALRNECDVLIDDLQRMDFDCYVNVVGATDGLHHLFWLFSDPFIPITPTERRIFGDAVRRAYLIVDRMISRLLDIVPMDVPVLFVSDHGAGPEATRSFRANHWLLREGLLTSLNPADVSERPVPPPLSQLPDTPDRRAARARRLWDNRLGAWRRQVLPLATSYARAMLPSSLVDWIHKVSWRPYRVPELGKAKPLPFKPEQTKAYACHFGECCGGIAIHLKGRTPGGIVEPGTDYDALCDRIVEALRHLKDPVTQSPVCEAVWRREELFEGPYLEQAPDIVFLLNADYKLELSVAGPFIANRDESQLFLRSGEHTRWGTCIARGRAFPHQGVRLDGARLIDIAPTVLALMQVPIPDDFDGRVLDEWLAPEVHYQTHAGQTGPAPAGTNSGLNDQEMAEVLQRLKDLGYVE